MTTHDAVTLADYERTLLAVFQSHVCTDGTLDQAHEAFLGAHQSPETWAHEYLTNEGVFQGSDPLVHRYFDFRAYAMDKAASGEVVFVLVNRSEVWVFLQLDECVDPTA